MGKILTLNVLFLLLIYFTFFYCCCFSTLIAMWVETEETM